MSRKDYIAIAAAIKSTVESDGRPVAIIALGTAAERIADACARDNAAFDRERFLAACGVQQPRVRLEELRVELREERISYGEIAELQDLASFIDPSDVELLEAAGVPERL